MREIQVPDTLWVLYSVKEESVVYAFGPNVQQCWEAGLLIMYNVEKGCTTQESDRWHREKNRLYSKGFRARRAKLTVSVPDAT